MNQLFRVFVKDASRSQIIEYYADAALSVLYEGLYFTHMWKALAQPFLYTMRGECMPIKLVLPRVIL
jgi:hypothetical protein